MAQEWLNADLSLKYVSDDDYTFLDQCRICERAYSGLIAAKADKVIWDSEEQSNVLLPKTFWWAEGQEALEQDWLSGSFSTWIDEKIEAKAYGVSFDFIALSDLVPVAHQANAMRKISVVGSDEWISAQNLLSLMHQKNPTPMAGSLLQEACRLGQIGGRAMRACCSRTDRSHRYPIWTSIEWDIPLWFWRDFADPEINSLDWRAGKMKASGRREGKSQHFDLQGIHFHVSGLVNLGLGLTSTQAARSKAGRKAVHDWQAANSAIWGQIFRGELIPDNQAMIERALIVHLTKGDKEPSESTVRPYAKQIWAEFNKA